MIGYGDEIRQVSGSRRPGHLSVEVNKRLPDQSERYLHTAVYPRVLVAEK